MAAVRIASVFEKGNNTVKQAVAAYVRAYPPSAAAATREATFCQDSFLKRLLTMPARQNTKSTMAWRVPPSYRGSRGASG